MSRIFASEDIATLVANFSPLSLHSDRPLLLQARSGHALISSRKAAKKLEKLLSSEASRIGKTSLAETFGIEQGDLRWIIENLQSPPVESTDHQYLIPERETELILAELSRRAEAECLHLKSFASEKDVDYSTFERFFETQRPENLQSYHLAGTTYLCHQRLVDELRSQLRKIVEPSDTLMCEIPSDVTNYHPVDFIHELVNDLARETGGEIRKEGDRLMYIPAGHSAAEDEKLKQKEVEAVRRLVDELLKQRFCIIGGTSGGQKIGATSQAVLAEYRSADLSGEDVVVVEVGNEKQSVSTKTKKGTAATLMIRQDILQLELEALRLAIANETEKAWNSDERATRLKSLTQTVQRRESAIDTTSQVSKLLLQSEHAAQLLLTITERTEELAQGEHQKFLQFFEACVLLPFQLHILGIDTVQDATLKQHLQAFILDHFRLEVIPQTIKAAREQHLLRDATRDRQITKLQQATTDARSLDDVHASVDKFCKKLNVETKSSPEALAQAKLRTLEATIKSMKQMKRASDILQNLIWVLLAKCGDGLLISSGKDTSRMIKHYEAVGDAEMAARLVKWRDVIKAGQESADELKAMRELAAENVLTAK